MQHKILLLDDNETNLKILSLILEKGGYLTESFTNGLKALERLKSGGVHLILTDISMPEINGFEFCKRVKNTETFKHIPIVFISALSDINDIVEGFKLGGVDYITKPFNAEEVKSRVSTHLMIFDFQNYLQRKVEEQIQKLAATQMETIFSLAKLAQSRDDDTGLHLERVQGYCKLLAKTLQEDSPYANNITDNFIETIYAASPLQDIGKVGIPDNILLKPSKLTPEEFEIMKTHTTVGADTLIEVDKKFGSNSFIQMGILIAYYHHEKYDGSGYPDGLKGERIPLAARIMAIADVYDALRSRRSYKEPFSHEESREIILKECGNHFDPVIVEAFKKNEIQFDKIYSSAMAQEICMDKTRIAIDLT